MENLLKDIDKTLGSAYSIIWKDYQNHKKELPNIEDPETFAKKFIETIMILHYFYTTIDTLFAKDVIDETTYQTATKILDTETQQLKELLVSRLKQNNIIFELAI